MRSFDPGSDTVAGALDLCTWIEEMPAFYPDSGTIWVLNKVVVMDREKE